jgi:hypothetical protein
MDAAYSKDLYGLQLARAGGKLFPLAVVAKVYWASQEACSYRHVLASLAKMISGAPGASGSASTSATARAHVGRSMSSIRSWFRTDLLIVIVRRL